MKKLGIDIGSLYTGAVLLDENKIRYSVYIEHNGKIASALKTISETPQLQDFSYVGITSSTGIDSFNIDIIDPILAQSEGARFLVPDCRSVFSIGGETFSLIMFDKYGKYKEHSVNSPCAAGTGSFLEQQAERLGLDVREMAEKALQAKDKIPSIATRCSVFAKTDIIHAMQEGYPVEAIAAGLCNGISRNVLSILVKGRKMISPVTLIGGVSQNRKIRQVMSELLGCAIIEHEYSHLAGAIGAALLGKVQTGDVNSLFKTKAQKRKLRPGLELVLSEFPDFSQYTIYNDEHGVEVFLPGKPAAAGSGIIIGIDIGSTSTKAVCINRSQDILGGFYTSTAGNPVQAVGKVMKSVRTVFEQQAYPVQAVCTTGSGRKMIRELFSADMEINEITAHARAAIFLTPEADTIIEIGGQDSKFTCLRNGNVYYSTMNYVCAAGTGSFIEEQARRLDVSLQEFSDMAFHSEAPYTSDRCTVYMERDLGVLLSEQWPVSTLAASVLHSVRDNYISKVVNKSPLGNYIVFQGATARNKALVAAFEQQTGKAIHVSPYCHLTGALGAALLVLEKDYGSTEFMENPDDLEITEEICSICANNCLLTVVGRNGRKTGWGMKCGSDYASRSPRKKQRSKPEIRFSEAMAPLSQMPPVQNGRGKTIIAVPEVLYNIQYAGLWTAFLRRLGFTVQNIKSTDRSIARGKEIVNSDFCAAMVLAHGCLSSVAGQKADYIFFPALVNENNTGQELHLFRKKTTDAYFCYYSQYFPAIISKLTTLNIAGRLLSPLVYFNSRTIEQTGLDLYNELVPVFPDLNEQEVISAFSDAYSLYESCLANNRKAGMELVRPEASDKIQVVILGRPYIAFDSALNLQIPHMLEENGAEVFWMDELDLKEYQPQYANKYLSRMQWHYGKTILKAAEYCAAHKNLFPVYLSCFRCSPDSFLISYVKDIMETHNKPFLVLQLDEHSSDVGYATRIEAGLQSFTNYLGEESIPRKTVDLTVAKDDSLLPGDTVLVPYLDNLVSYFWTACFERNGNNTVLLSADEASLNTGYKYANGGECMPLVSITGGVIEAAREYGLVPESSYLYLPSMCMACNFPQFPIFADMALAAAGLGKMKIGLVNIMSPGEILPQSLAIRILESNIVGSIIYKLYFRVKPYETSKGDSDTVIAVARELIADAIRQGNDLKPVLAAIADRFRSVARDESAGRKPRIGLIGDLYVKFNEVVNQQIIDIVDRLGGELVVPSLTEYPFHFYDADIRLYNDNPRSFKLLRIIEGRFEKIAEDLLGDNSEPDFAECVQLMEEYKIRHYIAGETSISIGRALYFIRHRIVNAIIHVNPMFCCPGVVSSSIFRKMQEDFGISIIDIFYDGTGSPNKVLIPHLHYLNPGNC
ncbi:MAG: hypothetical protein JW874_07820 [Spirochaetales bacterium]|nr:hypothetical protein [Spirochaetales bacterium]